MLNESDTRAKLVDPQLHRTGWHGEKISRGRYITDGRIYLVGEQTKRKEKKKPDYILLYKPSTTLADLEWVGKVTLPVRSIHQGPSHQR